MHISENLQKTFAFLIAGAFFAAMILEWRSGFEINFITHPLFWVVVGPLILINTHAITKKEKISMETRRMLAMMLIISLAMGLLVFVLWSIR